MPSPFPFPAFDWPGVALMRRFVETRRRRQGNVLMRAALGSEPRHGITSERILDALRRGADPNAVHAFGTTSLRPLEWAVKYRQFRLAVDLLDAGARPDDCCEMPSIMPVLYGSAAAPAATLLTVTLEALARQCRDARHDSGIAWRRDDQQLQNETWLAAQAFMEHGVNPWQASRSPDAFPRTTPLHLMASIHPRLRGIPRDLIRQLDPQRTDALGDTAAHVVARCGEGLRDAMDDSAEAPVVQGLLALEDAGADLQQRNLDGLTPLDILAERVLRWERQPSSSTAPLPLSPASLGWLHNVLPDLRWDVVRPDGESSPMGVLRDLLICGKNLMAPAHVNTLTTIVLREEQRAERRALLQVANATMATPDTTVAARSRSRL